MKTASAAIIACALLAAPAAAQDAEGAGGQSLTRAQFISQMDAQFTALDTDQNGTVTGEEIDQRSRQLRQSAALQLNQTVFQQLDQDGNGALSPSEFAVLANPEAVSGVPVPTLQEFDRDGDGQISLVEYRIRTQSNFDNLDQDRDGVMSPAELQAAGLPGG